MGELGSATTAKRISDPGALQVLAKNSDLATFDFCNSIGQQRKFRQRYSFRNTGFTKPIRKRLREAAISDYFGAITDRKRRGNEKNVPCSVLCLIQSRGLGRSDSDRAPRRHPSWHLS